MVTVSTARVTASTRSSKVFKADSHGNCSLTTRRRGTRCTHRPTRGRWSRRGGKISLSSAMTRDGWTVCPAYLRSKQTKCPCCPSPDKEYTNLLKTIPVSFPDSTKSRRFRALIRLMRYSRLAIRHAATLRRDELIYDTAKKRQPQSLSGSAESRCFFNSASVTGPGAQS